MPMLPSSSHSLRLRLLTTDYATVIYLTLTGLAILFFPSRTIDPVTHLLFRLGVLVLLFALALFQNRKNKRLFLFLRLFIPVLLLSYIYGDTSALNHLLFPHTFDAFFSGVDQWLFGFQPSLEFSKVFPEKGFGEILYMGYFSYYFMLLTVSLVYFIYRRKRAEEVVFIILTSFYLYYVIFIILPTEGPQYYFPSPENEAINTGFFSSLVHWVQQNWEHPTGAFPSSHVGMALIYLFITHRDYKTLFYILLPFSFIILFATVYIKAHYAIDVIGGIITAPFIYWIAHLLFKKAKILYQP